MRLYVSYTSIKEKEKAHHLPYPKLYIMKRQMTLEVALQHVPSPIHPKDEHLEIFTSVPQIAKVEKMM